MAAVRATRKHCLRMKVSVAGAASGIMGVAAGGGGAIGIGGHRDGELILCRGIYSIEFCFWEQARWVS